MFYFTEFQPSISSLHWLVGYSFMCSYLSENWVARNLNLERRLTKLLNFNHCKQSQKVRRLHRAAFQNEFLLARTTLAFQMINQSPKNSLDHLFCICHQNVFLVLMILCKHGCSARSMLYNHENPPQRRGEEWRESATLTPRLVVTQNQFSIDQVC